MAVGSATTPSLSTTTPTTATVNKNNNHHHHKSSQQKSLWSDLPRRFVTVCIGFPLVWKCLSNSTLAYIFFMGAHALACWEFTLLELQHSQQQQQQQQQSHSKVSLFRKFGFCMGSLMLCHITSTPVFHCMLGLVASIYCIQKRHYWMIGLLLLTIPFRTWYHLATHDFPSTISVLLVVWNCDTGALIFGRLSRFGATSTSNTSTSSVSNNRREQRPFLLQVPSWIHEISPAKSMEGFYGGILVGTWTAVSWIPWLVSWFMNEKDLSPAFVQLWISNSLLKRTWLGISLSILAILGDLVESSIKRHYQSKDSGTFLPGHGGILDRFDSTLLAVLLYQALMD